MTSIENNQLTTIKVTAHETELIAKVKEITRELEKEGYETTHDNEKVHTYTIENHAFIVMQNSNNDYFSMTFHY